MFFVKAVAAALLVALCSISSVQADSAAGSKAGKDWQAITSSGPRPARKLQESSLGYFMRQVELSDVRRRELGLKFWNDHPNDARRYKWLLLTVHMPPHYAKNIDEWADNETRLEANAAAIDVKALERWNKRYPVMRQEYWSSKDVSEQERRFLWFGELEQKILRMKEAVARGETVDAKPVLNEIVRYGSAYREPLSERDSSEFYWCNQTLIGYVSQNMAAFKIDRAARLEFAAQLAATGNRNSAAAAAKLTEQLNKKDDGDAPTNGLAAATLGTGGKGWSQLPPYPSNQPTTYEGYVIFYHAKIVNTRKYRDIGMRLWNEYPDHKQRLRWMGSTHWSPPTYLQDITGGLHLLAASAQADVAIDEIASNEWESIYPQLRAQLWNDPATTEAERRSLRAQEVWTQLWVTQQKWKKNGDKLAVKALLDSIHELYTKWQDADNTYRHTSTVFQNSSKYGLSDQELRAFLTPMLSYEDEDLRKLARGKQRFLELREIGIELQAPTLEGKQFDIKALRGKIVLLDYWATSCSSCIGAMPRIKGVYDRYKDRGFEVVSVCFDAEKNRTKVEKAEKEMGVTWTTLAADSIRLQIKDRYGYSGVPEYMLIDRAGKLVAATSEIDMGRNLEPLLNKMLAEESARVQ